MGKSVIVFFMIFTCFVSSLTSSEMTMETQDPVLESPVFFAEDYEPIYTAYKSEESEEYLWNEISKHSPSDIITAGILGYFKRESEFRSDAVSHWQYTVIAFGEDPSMIFTEEIDAGLEDGSTREQFVYECQHKYGGYGLGQWSSTTYCEDLYSFARAYGASIGDAEMQCAFIIPSIMQNEYLWNALQECTSARRAGELIALLYDGSYNAMEYASTMAVHYYNKYVKE